MDDGAAQKAAQEAEARAKAEREAAERAAAGRAALQAEVSRYVKDGYRVLSQTETSAQLVKPKKFSILWFIIWLIIGVLVGALIYLGWYLAKKDATLYLTVGADGKVKTQAS